MELYNYQTKTINELRLKIQTGLKRLIMCAPTGAGKTVMFSFMLQSAIKRKKKCLVLTHRTELLTQAGGILNGIGCDVVNLDAKSKTIPESLLYVAMTQTLIRRVVKPEYAKLIQEFDLIIIDESHLQSFNSLLPYIDNHTVVIGATATPIRSGNQKSLDEFYNAIVEEVTISELIRLGYLATPNYYGFKIDLSQIKTKGNDYDSESLGDYMSRNKIYNGVYSNYTRLTPNTKALIFAPNINSSKKLVNELIVKGLPIKHLDGNTPDKERKEILNWFETTPNAMLSNVGILTAGYDHNQIQTIILYRATKSLPLYLQMVGRGSRVNKKKKEFTILDFGNNIYNHDFWHIDRNWSLLKKEKKEGVAPVKTCPTCSALLPVQKQVCDFCGTELPKTDNEIREELEVELSKITASDVATFIRVNNWQKLEQYAEFKGYKKSWIHYKLPIDDLEAYAEYKGYNKLWLDRIKTLRNGK